MFFRWNIKFSWILVKINQVQKRWNIKQWVWCLRFIISQFLSVHIFIGAGSYMLNEFNKLLDSFQPLKSDFYIFGERGSGIAPSLGAFGGFCSSIISILLEAHVEAENILLLDSSLILDPRLELLIWEVFYYMFLSFWLIFFCLLLQLLNSFILCLSYWTS